MILRQHLHLRFVRSSVKSTGNQEKDLLVHRIERAPLIKSPRDWQKVLQLPSLKMEWFIFFVEEWTRNADNDAIGNVIRYFGLEEECYCFRTHEVVVFREEMVALTSQHKKQTQGMFFT